MLGRPTALLLHSGGRRILDLSRSQNAPRRHGQAERQGGLASARLRSPRSGMGGLPLRPPSWKVLSGLEDHNPIVPSSQTDRTGAGYVGSLIAPTAIPIKVGCFPKTRIFFLEGLDKFFARQPVGQISQQNPGRTAAPWSGISAALMLNLFSSRSSFGNSITSPARQLTDLVMPAINVALRRTTIGRRIASRDDVAVDLDGAHSPVGRSDERGLRLR
jgi:hypothetical protein